MSLPVVVFDTSAIGFLFHDAPPSEAHLEALTSRFDVWVTAMSVDETIATPDPTTREKLVAGLQRLLASGQCVLPPHEILRVLCSAHARSQNRFDWSRVDIGAPFYERAIIERDFTSELCETQLREQQKVEDSFMSFWQGLRSKLDPYFGSDPAKRPQSYQHAAEIAKTGTLLVDGLGKPLYRRGSGKRLGGPKMRQFMEACPPFRAICYGEIGSWFDVALAPQVFKKRAGRNDHMMAVYLPYCSHFVTADRKQETRLREIAVEAKVDCEVLSYVNFVSTPKIVA
jgi:hypothetical protein